MKKVIIPLLFGLLVRCTAESPATSGDTTERPVYSGDTTEASCAYFTEDNKKNIVLGWVKEFNDSQAVMCYAISGDNGNTFNAPVEITPSNDVHPHGENLPKIIFKTNGDIIAMWGTSNPTPKSKYSGLVYYSQSFDNGKTWSAKTALVKDTSAYDQRYFDMELLPGGEVMAIWLDNRGDKKKEGSTLFCAVTNGRNGFENEKAIGETCCPCCRTDLFTDSKGNIHAAYRDIINDTIRDMVHLISTDQGKTFAGPVRISNDNWAVNACPHTGPAITENSNGLHFAWYTMGGGSGVFYCNSKDLGKTFSARDSVSSKPSAKHPQVASLPNGNIVIVWDETVKRGESSDACIACQVRNPQGDVISTRYISSAGAVAEYAVVKPIDEKNILVAYRQRRENKGCVYYKHVSL